MVETLEGKDKAYVRVTNSGSALPQDRVEQVFERFWRGDEARSAPGSHSGLGLFIVKRLVALLGGKVKVRSSAGGEFRISVSIVKHEEQ